MTPAFSPPMRRSSHESSDRFLPAFPHRDSRNFSGLCAGFATIEFAGNAICPCDTHSDRMIPASTAEKVRGLIRETFDRLGADGGEVRETILIRDGYYCGRRYHRGGLQAIWFIEENQLKFHAPDGSVLEVRSAGEEPLRRAA